MYTQKSKISRTTISSPRYTAYAGWAVTAGIPVKFGNTHGKSRPEVGSGFPIDAYGNRGVSRPSLICGSSDLKDIPPIDFLGPIHNFYLLTVCS